MKNVLFICSGNSARSLMAEAILNMKSEGRFEAFSAGLHPAGLINPFAAQLIGERGYSVDKLRSKKWVEFVLNDAPVMDFVITLCKEAEYMAHPIWPGKPVLAKWDIQNPTAFMGNTESKRDVFRQTMTPGFHGWSSPINSVK